MRIRSTVRTAVLTVLAGLLVVTGCDTTIEPFSQEATYSVYGFLSLNRSRQFVRVKSLQAPLDGDTSRTLDATVTLENLDDGSTTTLHDSIVVFRDANSKVVTHNYWTDLSVDPGTRYKLTVEDDEGTTTATTKTPLRVNAYATPNEGNCFTDFLVVFLGIKEARLISQVSVIFRGEQETLRYRIDGSEIYGADHGQLDNAFFEFTPAGLLGQTFGFNADNPDTPCLRETNCSKLASKEIVIRYTYLGENWYGSVPEDSLVTDPLNAPGIRNGSGFFGSVGRGENTVRTDTSAVPSNDPMCP